MVEVLLFASWFLSLAFAFFGGMAAGYAKSHRDKMQFIEGLRDKALEVIEGAKCLKKD